jgi:hypothetical protein
MNAEMLREQCWHACQVLREKHTHVVPYSFIGKILGIDKGTVKYHNKRYEALGSALGRNVPSLILGDEYREVLVRQIEEADHQGLP